MTLLTPQPPASALIAVHTALRSEQALHQPAAAALRQSPGPLLAAHPLPVYVLDEVAGRLASARQTGWRFLVTRGAPGTRGTPGSPGTPDSAEVAASAEVIETADGHAFSHFTTGPYLDSTVRVLHQAWQLTHGAPARHQPRLLSLPGHYATALWLHSRTAGEDLLIPLAPAPLGVTAHRVYPAAELLARLDTTAVAAPALLARP